MRQFELSCMGSRMSIRELFFIRVPLFFDFLLRFALARSLRGPFFEV